MAFRVLTIDGGGARGIYPAHILKRIQESFDIDLSEHIDLIVGTSTGSIIASAIATNYPLDKIESLYEKDTKNIFKKRIFGRQGILRARYSKDYLYEKLNEAFGEVKLGDIKNRLVIPAIDISNGTVHVFKSGYLPEFVRDTDVKLVDAITASCSAPSYFIPHKVGEYLLADGGLWANNPTLVGLTEAEGKLRQSRSDINILSIGTGIGHAFYDPGDDSTHWGLKHWGSKLIDLTFNLQSSTVENIAGLILEDDQYMRLNFQETGKLELDNTKLLPRLKSIADRDFTYNSKRIKKILEIT